MIKCKVDMQLDIAIIDPTETVMYLPEFKQRICEAMIAPVMAQSTGRVMCPAIDAKEIDINDEAEEEAAKGQNRAALHMLLSIPGNGRKSFHICHLCRVEEKHVRCRSACQVCDLALHMTVSYLFITALHCAKPTHPDRHNCASPERIGKNSPDVYVAHPARIHSLRSRFRLSPQEEVHGAVVKESNDKIRLRRYPIQMLQIRASNSGLYFTAH